MNISEIISKLPIPAEKQEMLYEISLQFVKGHSTSEETIQRLRQLFIDTAELENENRPPISGQLDLQSRLNSVIDELWNTAAEERYLEYQRLFAYLRELFRTLHEKINTTQQELSEVRREVDLLRTEIKSFNTSEGSLLLGSLSVQKRRFDLATRSFASGRRSNDRFRIAARGAKTSGGESATGRSGAVERHVHQQNP